MDASNYLELLEITGQATGAFAMDGVAILFAYVVAAHFAGKMLSHVQVIGLTCVYTLFLLVPVTGAMQSSERVEIYTRQFREAHPEIASNHLNTSYYSNLDVILGIVFITAWMLSILYMISVRRAKAGVT